MTELSILVPARNEEFLPHTVEDILRNSEADTEVIVILDGYLPNPSLKPDPRIKIIYHPESVGQRKATNDAARIARGKYVMKVDAHCAFDKGFDRVMLEAFKETGDNVTMCPQMKNFHIFDWICPDGHRRYQGPSGVCQWIHNGTEWVYAESKNHKPTDRVCGKPTVKDIVWQIKHNPTSTAFCFDSEPHFQYDNGRKNTEEYKRGIIVGNKLLKELNETMSFQGSCFMCTKENYFKLKMCDEEYFSSWGSQGIEVACKTWLSGGRCLVNKRTFYAHMFRTQGGDFGFPYPNPQSKVSENKQRAKDLFFKGKWSLQKYPLSWLVKKFWPVRGWTDEDLANLLSLEGGTLKKSMIYYTDSQLDEKIAKPVRDRLMEVSKSKNIPIVSSSLKKMDFGVKNVHFPTTKRGYLAMFKQVMSALEHSESDVIFFCEHDVLYHPSHFDFVPKDKNTFYYNQNVWFIRMPDGHTLHYDVNQLSGLCGYREALLIHFKERYELAEQKYKELVKDGDETEFNRWVRHCGFEPFTHNRIDWKNKFKYETWKSESPNVDIKHGANATGQRWNKDQYKNQQLLINWIEGEEIPGIGKGIDIVKTLQ